MRRVTVLGLSLVLLTPVGSASAAGAPLPATGGAVMGAYSHCRLVANIEMEEVGSRSAAECFGVVRTKTDVKLLDNLALHCLEAAENRRGGAHYVITCVMADADGDKLFSTLGGSEDGKMALIGGTGKFKGIEGEGAWSVTDAPGNTPVKYSYTLDISFSWKFK